MDTKGELEEQKMNTIAVGNIFCCCDTCNCSYYQNYVDLIKNILQVRQISVKFHCKLFRLSFATGFQSHTKIRQNKLHFHAKIMEDRSIVYSSTWNIIIFLWFSWDVICYFYLVLYVSYHHQSTVVESMESTILRQTSRSFMTVPRS